MLAHFDARQRQQVLDQLTHAPRRAANVSQVAGSVLAQRNGAVLDQQLGKAVDVARTHASAEELDGIRADLTFPSSTAGEGDGNVTYGEAFTVQPFGNSLTLSQLTSRSSSFTKKLAMSAAM